MFVGTVSERFIAAICGGDLGVLQSIVVLYWLYFVSGYIVLDLSLDW